MIHFAMIHSSEKNTAVRGDSPLHPSLRFESEGICVGEKRYTNVIHFAVAHTQKSMQLYAFLSEASLFPYEFLEREAGYISEGVIALDRPLSIAPNEEQWHHQKSHVIE